MFKALPSIPEQTVKNYFLAPPLPYLYIKADPKLEFLFHKNQKKREESIL